LETTTDSGECQHAMTAETLETNRDDQGPGGVSRAEREGDIILRGEWTAAGLIFVCILCLRIGYNFRVRFNSDEPQHLHVVWVWATGLLPYKEVFDNHMPLFHLLMAPILRLFGERADILIWMRFVMLPLYALSVWAVFRIGSAAFSRRAGLWASVLVAAWAGTEQTGLLYLSNEYRTGRFFFKMCEFRTDVLWTVFWLMALLVIVARPVSRKSVFLAGLLLGAALGVSMKTSVLIIALLLSTGGTLLIMRQAGVLAEIRLFERLTAGLAGFCVIPVMIIGYFGTRHALPEMYYCVVAHNVQAESALSGRVRHHLTLILAGGAIAWFTARRVFRAAPDPSIGSRRVFLVLLAFIYYIVLYGFWPMVPPQDLLPSDAMMGICLGALLIWFGNWLTRVTSRPIWGVVPMLAVVGAEFALILTQVDIRENSTSRVTRLIGDVLKLTAPGQKIMDGKGETIYRPRATYFVLETIANKGLEKGTLKDTFVEDMVRANVTVVHDPDRMPPKDTEWVKANYVSVGSVYVAGKLLTAPRTESVSFDVAIPEIYVIVADHGTFDGELDGMRYTGPRYLSAGRHEFRRSAPNSRQQLVLMWAHAAEAGYPPLFSKLGK